MNCIFLADKTNCKLLEEFIGKFTILNLIDKFDDPCSFMNILIIRQDIDLVFITMEIRGEEILNFISRLKSKPNVIIISSDDENALKAFDYNVVDYLITPIAYSRFFKAIDKAIRYYSSKETKAHNDDFEFFIKKGSSLVKLKLKEIVFVEALENYIVINTCGDNFTIHFTMKAIESQLPDDLFIRVHRSFIVNKKMIKTINDNSLDLHTGTIVKKIPVGSIFRDSLLSSINVVSR
jgi:DNA-binding LytR/AlgR family response regulator